ncbi:hypothetical protein Tco_0888447, partial [Tanacetum coccineum]
YFISKSKRVKRKRFVKPKVVPVKSNVGKRKRLDEDVASEEVEDEDVVSDEDGDDVDECVSDEEGNDAAEGNDVDEHVSDEEGNDAAEGNDVDEHVSDEEEKESEEDKGSEEVDETNEAEEAVKKSTKGKKKGVVSKFLILILRLKKRRTVPCSLFAAIRDSQVDMKSFLWDVGFSSLSNVFIDALPARLARFVVRAFSGSSYEFKLDKGIMRVTPEKIHEILGVPLGGTSIFNLPEIPLDDPFVKLWFKQFHPKPLKDIYAYDIAEKLVIAKRVDFMFEVNFLMLFANVMGTSDTMKAIVNLTVLRHIREDTNIAAIDWCGFIHKCLQDSVKPKTVSFLIHSTKFDRFSVIRQRPAIRNWTTTAMNLRKGLEIQEEVIGKLDLHGIWTQSKVDQTEGFYDVGDNVSRLT